MIFDVDEECWLRALRRNMLLLCVIYHLNRKLEVVTEKEIRNFVSFLEKVNPEIYRNIVKPNRPLEYTVEELSKKGLIILDGGHIKVNENEIKSEKDLMYWKNIGNEIEEAYNEYVYRLTKNLTE